MSSVMRQFQDNSYLFGGNAPFIEDLYEKYLANPQSVPEQWREYFDRMQVLPGSTVKDVARAPVEQSFVQRAKRGELGGAAPCVLNAANEAAVAAFLGGRCRFIEIVPLVAETLEAASMPASPDLDELVALDAWARGEVDRACEAARILPS